MGGAVLELEGQIGAPGLGADSEVGGRTGLKGFEGCYCYFWLRIYINVCVVIFT